MTKVKALEIFHNLKSEEYTHLEKVEAIVDVSQMPTHNSVKKAAMVEAICYLTELMKNLVEESQSTESV